MTLSAETIARRAPPQAPMIHTSRPAADALLLADCVRAMAGGGSERPVGLAEAASVLWTQFLKYDAADPSWPDRDRFVAVTEGMAPLVGVLRRLTGHVDVEADEAFGADSGHGLGNGRADGSGDGLGVAVGLALAERLLAARFGRSLVDHRTWALARGGELMRGTGHEAASLAGELRLERLTVLYEDHADSPLCREELLRRFVAYGWAVKSVDAHDPAAMASALGVAARARRPTLIACRSRVGQPARLPRDPFRIPDPLAAGWRAAGGRGAAGRRSWLKRLARHPSRPEFERVMGGRLPEGLQEALTALKSGFATARQALAPRAASARVVEAASSAMAELVGGAAAPVDPAETMARGMSAAAAGSFAGRYLAYGPREHAMAAAMNGIAAHGGLVPYAGAALGHTDAMRPALRLAAGAGRQTIHLLTEHPPEESGACDPASEHLACLRAVANLHVLRPCDAVETAECWELALRRGDGPSLLVLGGGDLPAWRGDAAENRSARGGYVLAEAEGPRQATLIATGAEVTLAMEARAALAATGIAVAVVSLPCWALFAQTEAAYRASVLGGVPRFGIEAGSDFGWERWLGPDGVFVGGPSGSRRAGRLTAAAIAETVRQRLAG